MKKILTITAVALVAVLALGFVGYAYAQTQTPPDGTRPYGYGQMGPGMMGGRQGGGFGRGMMGAQTGTYGPMHTYMVDAFAAALGMTPEDLQAELDAGKTMWTVAEENGYTAEQFTDLMIQARTEALSAMVAAGTITQEQADWMLQRMGQMQGSGYGPGNCPMNGGAGGPGRGPARWNPGT